MLFRSAILANFLLNFFSQDGHEDRPGARQRYGEWVLATAESIWHLFTAKFRKLWSTEAAGDAYPRDLFAGDEGRARLAGEQCAYLTGLWQDTLGFAAAEMIRRILGLAHNIDLEWINDKPTRAACEARALTLARDMMVNPGNYPGPSIVTEAARRLRSWQPPLGR